MTKQSQAMRVLTSHASVDWYTPPDVVELARYVLGAIDLDPASAAVPQVWIKATKYYTIADDGLAQPWAGRVWLNPPYGKDATHKSNQAVWGGALERCYVTGAVTEAILLINSTHGYKWFEDLYSRWPCCQARERIRFIDQNGMQGAQAKRGQTFVYFGPDYRRFIDVFAPIGRILVP